MIEGSGSPPGMPAPARPEPESTQSAAVEPIAAASAGGGGSAGAWAPRPQRAHWPLAGPACAFAAGVWAGDAAGVEVGPALGAAAVCLLAAWLVWWRGARPMVGVGLLLAACAAVGAARLAIARSPAADDVALTVAVGAIVTLDGTVASDPVWHETASRFSGRAEEAAGAGPDRRASFVLDVTALVAGEMRRPASGRLRVSLYADPPEVASGDRVRVSGRLGEPPAPLNPGQSDARAAFARRGILRTLRVTHAGAVRRLRHRAVAVGEAAPSRPTGAGAGARAGAGEGAGEGAGDGAGEAVGTERAPGVTVDATAEDWAPLGIVARWRRRLGDLFGEAVPGGQGPLAACLVLGFRGGLARDLEDAFQRSGTVHVLAVSGLQVGLIAALAWYLLRLCRCPRRTALVALLAAVFLYALVGGGSPAVVRATVMALAFFGAELVGRRAEAANSLALAALVLLGWRPEDLWDLGFVLSTVSVAGLIGVTPRALAWLAPAPDPLARLLAPTAWERVRDGARAYAAAGTALTLGAWGATWPLVANAFHLVTPVVVPANLILAPLVGLLLGLGLLLAGVGLAAGLPAAGLVGTAVAGGALALEGSVRFLAALPGAWFATPGVPGPALALYYGALLIWCARAPSRQAVAGLWGGLAAAAVTAWLLGAPGSQGAPFVAGSAPAGLRVTFLAVGHGSAVLLEFPEGERWLYDLGSQGTFDVGAEVAAPAAWSRGIRRIDRALISHPDADHYDGLPGFAARVPVSEALTSPWVGAAPAGRRVLADLARLGVPVRTVVAPAELPAGRGVEVRLLGPLAGAGDAAGVADNDLSLVLSVAAEGARFLLCGDIEASGIAALTALGEAARCDVLAVPHHGSRGSLDPRLLAACRPRFAVISSDQRFVAPEVVAAWSGTGARVLETWREGAVTFTVRAGKLEVETFR
ncbi:MAG: ComEC/Rec2 family competence protein [Planctomycetes bacterium]|nr:ComEC/Rec2 family competence protein [Planctomycetota bacterium]